MTIMVLLLTNRALLRCLRYNDPYWAMLSYKLLMKPKEITESACHLQLTLLVDGDIGL